MSTETKVFQLLIKDTGEASLNLLRYINSNIDVILKMGVKFNIIKIDRRSMTKKRMNELAKLGITELPAMITTNGKATVKVSKIIEIFEKNINSFNKIREENMKQDKKSGKCASFGDELLDEFYADLIDKDKPMDNDTDMNEDSGKTNFDKKLSDIKSKRTAQTEVKFGGNPAVSRRQGNGNNDNNNNNNNNMRGNMNRDEEDIDTRVTEIDESLIKNIKKSQISSEDDQPNDFMFEQAFLQNATIERD